MNESGYKVKGLFPAGEVIGPGQRYQGRQLTWA